MRSAILMLAVGVAVFACAALTSSRVGYAAPRTGYAASSDAFGFSAKTSSDDASAIPACFDEAPSTSSRAWVFIELGTPSSKQATPEKPWHIDLGLRVTHAKLSETEQMLDRRLDWPLKADILNVFGRPRTAIDRKTDFSINSFYLGVGRRENDWLTWTLYAGGGVASDKIHQRFIIANLSVRFSYALYYAGFRADLYPWGAPESAVRDTWAERVHASRPFVFSGVEVGYVNSEGSGYYALAPFKLYRDREHTRDWVFSYKLGLGWDIPLDEHWSLNLAGDYSFHFYRPNEYNSWNLNSGLRYRF